MTVVIDASALVALVAPTESMMAVAHTLGAEGDWNAPEHLIIEAASAIRGLHLGGRLNAERLDEAFDALTRTDVRSHATAPLLPRIRELAPNATTYDAAYIALAERLDAPLITIDDKLARIPGISCEVRVVRAA